MAVLRIASVHKVATKCGIALCGRHLGWTWDGHLQTCVLVSLFQRWISLISRMFDSCVCDHKLPDNVHLTYIYIQSLSHVTCLGYSADVPFAAWDALVQFQLWAAREMSKALQTKSLTRTDSLNFTDVEYEAFSILFHSSWI